jgi:hypothetical protein
VQRQRAVKKKEPLLDPERIGFLLCMLLAQFILVWFLVGKAQKWGGGVEGAGQIGDVVGGISNFVTSFVVTISAWFATRQFSKYREEHSHTVRSQVAMEMWRGTFSYASRIAELIRLA